MTAVDLRDVIFSRIENGGFTAALTAHAGGVLSGVDTASGQAERLGLRMTWTCAEGDVLEPGTEIARMNGRPKAIALAEERLLGCLCKPSGIATAARQAVVTAAGRIRVVSGAWKKMPPELKGMVRQAIAAGGMPSRIVDEPFIYLDKNYVRMLGGICATLEAVSEMPGIKTVQIRGEEDSIAVETQLACRGGAGIVMVDTGRVEDAVEAVSAARAFPDVRVAYAGGVTLEDIPRLADLGIQILDIGTVIVDAPLLDIKFDVVAGRKKRGV